MPKKTQLDKAIDALQLRGSDLKLRYEAEAAAIDTAIRLLQSQQRAKPVRKPKAVAGPVPVPA